MKRFIVTAAFFLLVLLVAGELSAILEGQLSSTYLAGLNSHSWLTREDNYVFSAALVYAGTYVIAGATLAFRASTTKKSMLLALLLGLAVPGVSMLLGPLNPFTYSTHAPIWLQVLFWANWYMPLLASLLGALIFRRLASRQSLAKNDA